MHEVELGVFKDLFTHLIRMCHAMGKDTVQELNERFVAEISFVFDSKLLILGFEKYQHLAIV